MLFAYSSRNGVENRDKLYFSQVHYYLTGGSDCYITQKCFFLQDLLPFTLVL